MAMNQATDYVHDRAIEYEPTYKVVMEAAASYGDGQMDLHEARDMIANAVRQHWKEMGLSVDDLNDEVDYAEMIMYEVG